ncbi:MAG: META domain-containing protein [Usitatibacter sp.]
MTIGRSIAGLFALGLGACAAEPDAPAGAAAAAPSLSGTRWVGVVDASTDRRAVPRLEFVREGRVTGFTGCNLLSGAWGVEGGEVRFGGIATTKRLCLGPEGEIEKRVLAVLGDKSRVTREGAKLVLVAPGGERFEFNEAPPTY